jgi:hypothetical protein
VNLDNSAVIRAFQPEPHRCYPAPSRRWSLGSLLFVALVAIAVLCALASVVLAQEAAPVAPPADWVTSHGTPIGFALAIIAGILHFFGPKLGITLPPNAVKDAEKLASDGAETLAGKLDFASDVKDLIALLADAKTDGVRLPASFADRMTKIEAAVVGKLPAMQATLTAIQAGLPGAPAPAPDLNVISIAVPEGADRAAFERTVTAVAESFKKPAMKVLVSG